MRTITIICIVCFPFLSFSQEPFKVCFTKMYDGKYDPKTHTTISKVQFTQVDFIEIVFTKTRRFAIRYYEKGILSDDRVGLDLRIEKINIKDNCVEYQMKATSGCNIFLRYSKCMYPAILEISIFNEKMDQFYYIR